MCAPPSVRRRRPARKTGGGSLVSERLKADVRCRRIRRVAQRRFADSPRKPRRSRRRTLAAQRKAGAGLAHLWTVCAPSGRRATRCYRNRRRTARVGEASGERTPPQKQSQRQQHNAGAKPGAESSGRAREAPPARHCARSALRKIEAF